MTFISTIFLVLLVISTLISLLIGAEIYRGQTETIGSQWLLIIFAGQAVWALAYALQLTRSQIWWWLTLERVVVTGASLVIAGWFLFILTYTAYERRLSLPHFIGLLSPFAAGVLAAWTNQYHELFWQLDPRPEVLVGAGGRYLQFVPGVVYAPWLSYLFVIAIATLLMLGAKYVRSQSLHRSQIGLMFVGILLPLIGNILFNAFNATALAVDITPVLFTATSILVVIALKRYRMTDTMPISQAVLLEQLSEGVIVTDEQRNVLHCNRAASKMFGEQLVGENFDAHLSLDREILDASSVTKAGISMIVDGNERHFDIKRTPYTDHRDEQRGAIFVFQDVTEREEHAAALARQNEQLDQFASVVSHDLQNPLHMAQGYLDLVREECKSEHLDAVENAHNRMATLIDDLLTLARQGDTIEELERVDLTALAETSWETIEATEATLVTDTERTIRADPDRVQQLLENLFQNAIDHGDEGVVVTIEEIPEGFSIEDDGPGLPEDARNEIFDAGYSTEDGGTGLGLYIVEKIAEAHGWKISVTESAAGGTRFNITGVEIISTDG